MAIALEHPTAEPENGSPTPVAPGIHWLRMPLPFSLDHINLWLIDDGAGTTLIDSGIAQEDVRECWRALFAGRLRERPAKQLIVSHFHPDHVGLAGWLCAELGIEAWSTEGEWDMAQLARDNGHPERLEACADFLRGHGADPVTIDGFAVLMRQYGKNVGPLPSTYRRIRDGDAITIDGREWRVIVGTGHSPEHACLHCPDLNVLISGDMVLPRISTNIAVMHNQPRANPLRDYLDSLRRLRALPTDCLVLPSHGLPFRGLHARIDDLIAHHDARFEECVDACATPITAVQMVPIMFRRELDPFQRALATGEALAHFHYLADDGRLRRDTLDGVTVFAQNN